MYVGLPGTQRLTYVLVQVQITVRVPGTVPLYNDNYFVRILQDLKHEYNLFKLDDQQNESIVKQQQKQSQI